MKKSSKRSIGIIFLALFFGVIIASIISLLVGFILPEGNVVRDFFLLSQSIGWGSADGNWVDLFFIRFKTGFYVDISITSILGISVSWYFLRYFR
jgi:hypothetical protein